MFEVTGGISHIDLSLGGARPHRDLRRFRVSLGQSAIDSGAPDPPVFSSPFTSTSPVYIKPGGQGAKKVQLRAAGLPEPVRPQSATCLGIRKVSRRD
jgi:hypothetical protein